MVLNAPVFFDANSLVGMRGLLDVDVEKVHCDRTVTTDGRRKDNAVMQQLMSNKRTVDGRCMVRR